MGSSQQWLDAILTLFSYKRSATNVLYFLKAAMTPTSIAQTSYPYVGTTNASQPIHGGQLIYVSRLFYSK